MTVMFKIEILAHEVAKEMPIRLQNGQIVEVDVIKTICLLPGCVEIT